MFYTKFFYHDEALVWLYGAGTLSDSLQETTMVLGTAAGVALGSKNVVAG